VALGEQEGRQVRILNVGCGPAVELQRLIASGADLSRLSFTLLDFSRETLDYTRERIDAVMAETGRRVEVNYVQESVHDLLKRPAQSQALEGGRGFEFIYCAGLFDYLSDKVCTRLIRYFMSRSAPGARMLLTNVHSSNPERHGMEHLLEWHLIYRDEAQMMSVMSEVGAAIDLYTDQTGVNVFAETTLPGRGPLDTA
jgi:extracellular factor (EF) 3-hydroxypalmitic acid methyl ester biosynthesis protein